MKGKEEVILSFEVTPDAEAIEVHCNPAGLESLRRALSELAESKDNHVHLLAPQYGGEELSEMKVGVKNTKVLSVKIFRWS